MQSPVKTGFPAVGIDCKFNETDPFPFLMWIIMHCLHHMRELLLTNTVLKTWKAKKERNCFSVFNTKRNSKEVGNSAIF
jgi:hypothetical protein